MLETLKQLLDIEDNSKDTLLNIYIDRATLVIQQYLNRGQTTDEVQELYSTAIIYLVEKAYNTKNNTKDGIKQIQQGQRNVIYRDNVNLFSIEDTVKSMLPLPLIGLM
ncbi:head-tail connector protein [Clostridium sp. C8-1-8]|uniref:head-tail connector protein n=1 Tax=Clostridium sp. C8-1-8 TaxID=2698831 RepID=UPI00136A2D69|nr:head-tail connector protein [Clostridium sp. C8-1-8]